jgi:hypothetical protein
MVISDGFQDTSADQHTFNTAAANFFTYELLADSYFKAHASAFTIKTIFKETPAGSESSYGFVAGGSSNCDVGWDEATTDGLVEAAAMPQPDSPFPSGIVVIGKRNHPFGCSHGRWTYLSDDAVGEDIVAHEFGHLLVGLLDEYVHHPTDRHPTPPGPPDWLNCSTNVTSPPWGPFKETGCDLYGVGIVHPTTTCKMGNSGSDFCKVCKEFMDEYFNPPNPDAANPEVKEPKVENPEISNPKQTPPKPPTNLTISGAGFFGQPTPPPPSSQPATQSVRVLVRITNGTMAASVLRVTDSNAPVPPESQRRGDYVYAINENGNTLHHGVVTGDPFRTRTYQGGGSQHVGGTVQTGTVLATIPGETRTSLLDTNRRVEIWVYRLGPQAGRAPITRQRFDELRAKDQATRVAIVSSNDLKAAMK